MIGEKDRCRPEADVYQPAHRGSFDFGCRVANSRFYCFASPCYWASLLGSTHSESRPLNQLATRTRQFYFALSLLLVFLATLGFWSGYYLPLLSGHSTAEPVIHFHAAVYSGWLGLFVLQCLLVASGNIQLHRKLGNFGLAYGVVVIAVGFTTALLRFASRLEAGGIEAVQNTALAPLTDMLLFGAFFGAAAYTRAKPEFHKRLMLVAATTILIPSIARFVGGLDLEPALRHATRLCLWLSPIFFAMAFDFYTRKICHPVYVAGALAIVLFNFRVPLQYTDAWMQFTHWLASVMA